VNSPKAPDSNKAAMAGVTADLANYPLNYMVNALAQEGGKQTIGNTSYDFSGVGNADQSAQMSDKMAQALLDIQNNYGADYIQQRLADLKQSDPTGYAARQQLFDKILSDSKANPDRPMAEDLQNQVNTMLGTAGQLDEQGLQQVQGSVRSGQVERGIYLGNAPAAQEAGAVVSASDQLRAQQQSAAQNYLQSGVSPQDVTYRRIQQSLSNLGAFTNNQTPEAQFGQLSGAQSGAAPFNPVNYTTPATVDTGAARYGQSYANAQYGQQAQQAEATSNPYLSGLSFGVQGMNALGNMGAFSTSAFSNNPVSVAATGAQPAGGYSPVGGDWSSPSSYPSAAS
jgi:hypothetical protein